MPEPQEIGPPPGPAIGPAEQELAAALGGLELAPVRMTERDVWFRAGVETGRQSANRWRAVAAVVAALVVVGGGLLARRSGRGPVIVERIVYVERDRLQAPLPTTTTAAGAPSPQREAPALPAGGGPGYLRLRDAVARQGLGGLPPLPTAGDGGGTPGKPGRRPDGAWPGWPPGLEVPDADDRS